MKMCGSYLQRAVAQHVITVLLNWTFAFWVKPRPEPAAALVNCCVDFSRALGVPKRTVPVAFAHFLWMQLVKVGRKLSITTVLHAKMFFFCLDSWVMDTSGFKTAQRGTNKVNTRQHTTLHCLYFVHVLARCFHRNAKFASLHFVVGWRGIAGDKA